MWSAKPIYRNSLTVTMVMLVVMVMAMVMLFRQGVVCETEVQKLVAGHDGDGDGVFLLSGPHSAQKDW